MYEKFSEILFGSFFLYQFASALTNMRVFRDILRRRLPSLAGLKYMINVIVVMKIYCTSLLQKVRWSDCFNDC